MFPRSLAAALAVLLALALAACGGGESAGESPTTTTSAADSAPSAFPVTLDAENGPVVLDERPDQIVSLSPTATESLFAIGAGEQVIAVDDQSDYPAGAPRTDLSGFQPNVEAIAGYDPDLVVAGFDPGGLVKGLEKVGVEVLLQSAATDLEEAYGQIEELGAATGNAEEAEQIVTDMRARIEELSASASADAEGLFVYHEVSPDFYSATSKTFIGSVYELLGLENIADEAGAGAPDYPQLSAEYILSADPDLVVLADTECCGQTAAKVAKRPGWDGVAAVERGGVVGVSDDVASRWGPRTVEFVEAVVEALPQAGES